MRKLKLGVFVALSSSLLCSCFNGDYDLSDIDTSVKVSANNLTVPLNLDAITLDKVMDLSDGGKLKKVVDPETGESIYAVLETGSFLSSAVKIPEFSAEKPVISKIQSDLDMEVLRSQPFDELDNYIQGLKNQGTFDPNKMDEYEDLVWNQIKGDLAKDDSPLCCYTLDNKKTHFSTDSKTVDKTVRSVDRIGCYAEFTIDLKVLQLAGIVNTALRDLRLQLPKGLTLTPSHGTYDKATGILDLSNDVPILKNGVLTFNGVASPLKLTITGIDAKAMGIHIQTKDDADGTLEVAGDVEIVSGRIEVTLGDFVNSHNVFDLVRTGLHYECIPDLSEIKVTQFTGRLKYDIKDVNINPIALNNLPEILNDDNTNIVLANPQVYLKANNPLEKYNVRVETGFQFTGERNGVKRNSYGLDDGVLTIQKGDASFCLSPSKPKVYYPGYESAEYARFTGLRNILSGNGLPDVINVDVVNPCVPEQQVEDFELGVEVDKVEGEYTFYAPLSLGDGSVIVYEKKADGWDADVLDNLVIESLKVTATATSQIPLGATLTLSPLGKDGREISGVSFTCTKLEPNAKSQAIEFVQTGGVIKGLDGIQLRATIISDDAETILQPVQTLDMKNIRVVVSGYYQDEL